MRYIRFEFGTDYCTDGIDYAVFKDSVENGEIEVYADRLAQDNAAQHIYCCIGDDYEADEEAEYYEGVWYNWKELTKEEYKKECGE